MTYKDYDSQQCSFIKELIQDIYSTELIFQDFKDNELDINYSDEKFIIPYLVKLESNKRLLLSISNEKSYNRMIVAIVNTAKKTLKGLNVDLEKMFNYSIKEIYNSNK